MLPNELPKIIYPEVLCRADHGVGTTMKGQILLGRLLHLDSELKARKDQPVTVSLQFSVDSEGYCSIQGEIIGDLSMVCQRCMQPMMKTVQANILVSPVSSDAQAKQLPSQYEPLLMTNGAIDFAEWIAEELHLALPFVPYHDTDCVGNLNLS